MFGKKRVRKTLGKKIFSLPVLLIFIFLAVGLSCLYFVANVPSFKQVKSLAKQDLVVRNQVYAAASLLEALNNKAASGAMTMAQAKKMGADLLRDMRYGATRDLYFFADTTDGVNVVLPTDPATEGRNRLADSLNGVNYMQDILKNGQQADGGFTNYWYPKPGEATPKQKRAFSLLFKPWGWVVGSGYYLEDVQ